MGAGSGGIDAIRMIKREQRAAHARQTQRRADRAYKRSRRTESDELEQYVVAPARVLLRRECTHSKTNIAMMGALTFSFGAYETWAALFESPRINFGAITLPSTAVITVFPGLLLFAFLLAMIREFPRRFPDTNWWASGPILALAWTGVIAHIGLVLPLLMGPFVQW